MATDMHEGPEKFVAPAIEDEAVQWPLSKVLRWMQACGQKIELSWDFDSEDWTCLWSTAKSSYAGIGKTPHQATMVALAAYCQPFKSPSPNRQTKD